MATRTLSKIITCISHYCNNFAITRSTISAWKASVNIPRIKLVRMVWIFTGKLKIYHQVLYNVFHAALSLMSSRHCQT